MKCNYLKYLSFFFCFLPLILSNACYGGSNQSKGIDESTLSTADLYRSAGELRDTYASAMSRNSDLPSFEDTIRVPEFYRDSSVRKGTGFESPDYRQLSYKVRRLDENLFCLTEEKLRSHIELRLLQHGITPNNAAIGPDFPQLEITVTFSQNTFSMHLDISRVSQFNVGSTSYKKSAIMWNEEIMGNHDHDLDIIYDSLDYLMTHFIEQYLLSNHITKK